MKIFQDCIIILLYVRAGHNDPYSAVDDSLHGLSIFEQNYAEYAASFGFEDDLGELTTSIPNL
jgi:hypothetical protein